MICCDLGHADACQDPCVRDERCWCIRRRPDRKTCLLLLPYCVQHFWHAGNQQVAVWVRTAGVLFDIWSGHESRLQPVLIAMASPTELSMKWTPSTAWSNGSAVRGPMPFVQILHESPRDCQSSQDCLLWSCGGWRHLRRTQHEILGFARSFLRQDMSDVVDASDMRDLYLQPIYCRICRASRNDCNQTHHRE